MNPSHIVYTVVQVNLYTYVHRVNLFSQGYTKMSNTPLVPGVQTKFVVTISLHENTLQHTATHCNTLQHTATHCKWSEQIYTHTNPSLVPGVQVKLVATTLFYENTYCNTLQHTATLCNTLQLIFTRVYTHEPLTRAWCAGEVRGYDPLQVALSMCLSVYLSTFTYLSIFLHIHTNACA